MTVRVMTTAARATSMVTGAKRATAMMGGSGGNDSDNRDDGDNDANQQQRQQKPSDGNDDNENGGGWALSISQWQLQWGMSLPPGSHNCANSRTAMMPLSLYSCFVSHRIDSTWECIENLEQK